MAYFWVRVLLILQMKRIQHLALQIGRLSREAKRLIKDWASRGRRMGKGKDVFRTSVVQAAKMSRIAELHEYKHIIIV